ncbi:MAG: hypothetical protein GY790_07630 [Bacteroidetes bacterium]|nr:hypothetical protein [Bacteroidota bacterium]
MKRLFYLLIFISFLFLFFFLIRQDYIIPEIVSLPALAGSVLLLMAGFYAQTYSWKVALDIHGYPTTRGDAVVSQGLSVFAKYIPGKIWVIIGRAGYLSPDKKDLKAKSVISLKEQLIYLWAGFLISSIPTIIYYGLQWISILVLLIITGLTLFLFFPAIHNWSMGLLNRIMKSPIDVPSIEFRESVPLILSVSLVWAFWTSGFYLFMMAFSASITPVMMFAFPLSVCFGLIALFLPGGLGLREGIIIAYLGLAGLDVEIATTISFINRLWFVGGELFIFLLALLVRLIRKP